MCVCVRMGVCLLEGGEGCKHADTDTHTHTGNRTGRNGILCYYRMMGWHVETGF